MKRSCAVLLAAAMLLSAAGCAQDSKRPEPTEPAASAVSETSVENVEAAEDTPQKPQSSRRFDDSRISTLYDERFTYTDPYGIEDTYFYQVPQIDDDTEGAKNINEMIGYRFGYLVERALDARSRNDSFTLRIGPNIIPLTGALGEVLVLLCRPPRQCRAATDICRQLWHNDSKSKITLLQNYISQLRKLLTADPALHIVSLYNKGYYLQINGE